MTIFGRRAKSVLGSFLVVGAALSLASCSISGSTEETPDDASNAGQDTSSAEAVDIPGDTPAGEVSQRIVEILNAEEDTTVEDWEDSLHSSFTDEVSVDELVDLFNQNLRPAQPFTITQYDGGDRQAVTTLTSPVSAPMDMTVSVDAEGMIIGLFFGESGSAG